MKKELELDLVENRFTNGSSTVTSKNIGKLENITDCIQMQAWELDWAQEVLCRFGQIWSPIFNISISYSILKKQKLVLLLTVLQAALLAASSSSMAMLSSLIFSQQMGLVPVHIRTIPRFAESKLLNLLCILDQEAESYSPLFQKMDQTPVAGPVIHLRVLSVNAG